MPPSPSRRTSRSGPGKRGPAWSVSTVRRSDGQCLLKCRSQTRQCRRRKDFFRRSFVRAQPRQNANAPAFDSQALRGEQTNRFGIGLALLLEDAGGHVPACRRRGPARRAAGRWGRGRTRCRRSGRSAATLTPASRRPRGRAGHGSPCRRRRGSTRDGCSERGPESRRESGEVAGNQPCRPSRRGSRGTGRRSAR